MNNRTVKKNVFYRVVQKDVLNVYIRTYVCIRIVYFFMDFKCSQELALYVGVVLIIFEMYVRTKACFRPFSTTFLVSYFSN